MTLGRRTTLVEESADPDRGHRRQGIALQPLRCPDRDVVASPAGAGQAGQARSLGRSSLSLPLCRPPAIGRADTAGRRRRGRDASVSDQAGLRAPARAPRPCGAPAIARA
ncbi:hypothetical protein GLA29479_2715 [Lysobacter antibioticus]|nr:hypothetical protein GLA29479_2715 [Lysobacter antibioticus]